MPETLLFLLPLLGGYLFLHRCHWAHFPSQRLDGYRILFLSGVWGLAFGTLGRVSTYVAHRTALGESIERAWLSFSPPSDFPYSGSAMASVVIALLAAEVVNRIVPEDRANYRAIKKFGDGLLRLLVEAAESYESEKPFAVLISMDDRKVYAGYVLRCPNLGESDGYVVILPIASGYRHPIRHKVNFTVPYVSLWLGGEVPRENFMTYLPVASIKSAHIFDPDIYWRFFSGLAKDATEKSDSELQPDE